MSHPENTLKEIIEKQNKKIDGLINVIYSLASVIRTNDTQALNEYNYEQFLKHLDHVRKI